MDLPPRGRNGSPADERSDDDAPGGAAAVGTGLLRVCVRVRGVIALASPAAQPKWVEEKEQEVQGQTHQSHGTKQQNRLEKRQGAIYVTQMIHHTDTQKSDADTFICVLLSRKQRMNAMTHACARLHGASEARPVGSCVF